MKDKTLTEEILEILGQKPALNESKDLKRPGKAMSVHHLHDAEPEDLPTIEPVYGSHSKGGKKKTVVNPIIKE